MTKASSGKDGGVTRRPDEALVRRGAAAGVLSAIVVTITAVSQSSEPGNPELIVAAIIAGLSGGVMVTTLWLLAAVVLDAILRNPVSPWRAAVTIVMVVLSMVMPVIAILAFRVALT